MVGLTNRILALVALVSTAFVTAGCQVEGQQPKVVAKPKPVAAQAAAPGRKAVKTTGSRRVVAGGY